MDVLRPLKLLQKVFEKLKFGDKQNSLYSPFKNKSSKYLLQLNLKELMA